jgi:hypothetical protein
LRFRDGPAATKAFAHAIAVHIAVAAVVDRHVAKDDGFVAFDQAAKARRQFNGNDSVTGGLEGRLCAGQCLGGRRLDPFLQRAIDADHFQSRRRRGLARRRH